MITMTQPWPEKQEHCSRLCQTGRDGQTPGLAGADRGARSSNSADASWSITARPDCRCAPSPATWAWCRRPCTGTSSSRDELLTLLLVDAYSELADTVDRARDAVSDLWSDDVIAIARAARDWAVAHPAGWALLYGSPVPGYHAPRGTHRRPRHPRGRRLVRRDRGRNRHRRHPADAIIVAPQPMSSDFERTTAGVRLSRRRSRHRQMLPAVGRRGGCDQPRGVRAVRRRHVDRPAVRCSTPRCGCWSTCSPTIEGRIRTCSSSVSRRDAADHGNSLSPSFCRPAADDILR